MVFVSDIFLFLFLPGFLAVYYAAPARLRSLLIALGSYVFYGWWRPDFVLLMLFSTVLDYVCGARIGRAQDRGESGRRWLVLSVGVNLGLLAYFKYLNFGLDTVNAALGVAGVEPLQWARVVLPVGISFYTFQTMSYTIDIYRRQADPAPRFVDFMGYVALFPQLVAGPIVRYSTVAAELVSRTHSFGLFAAGARRFLVGLCRKVLIADSVAPLADAAFALPNPTAADAWLGTLAYSVQLYFDFSAYSDMAIGLGLMLGFHFPENFRHPYISRSITEFWQRWHISLSTWLRDYLYIPLGGNRHGEARTMRNLAIVMLLGGLWHGASWNFVIWGAWHGALLALERWWSRSGPGPARPLALPRALVLVLVMLGWVVFRAPDLGSAGAMFAGLFGANGLGLSAALAATLRAWPLWMLAAGLLLCGLEPWWEARRAAPVAAPARWAAWRGAVLVPLTLLALVQLAAQDYTPFLYFQF